MTNEEAIGFLECGAIPSCTCVSNKRYGGDCPGEDAVIEAIKVAIKALEKQIPVKRIRKHGGYFREYLISYCRVCGNEISNSQYQYHFCPDCGQAIDWSDEDGE